MPVLLDIFTVTTTITLMMVGCMISEVELHAETHQLLVCRDPQGPVRSMVSVEGHDLRSTKYVWTGLKSYVRESKRQNSKSNTLEMLPTDPELIWSDCNLIVILLYSGSWIIWARDDFCM